MSKKVKKTEQQLARSYTTQEFRDRAVKMVLEDKIEPEVVASNLNIQITNLRRWVAMATNLPKSSEQETIRELTLKNKQLEDELKKAKMEKDIIKKAMAYFAAGQN